MSISFKRIKTKWSATEMIRTQKLALSSSKLAKVHAGVLLTVAMVSLVYLIQVNTFATKGYEIRELEREIAAQKKENERLGLEIIERQSMDALQYKIAELGLVAADRIDYIAPAASVASAGTVTAR